MLTKNSIKIDKFYFFLAIVLLVLSIVVIFTARGIFEGIDTANTVDQESLKNDAARIDASDLDKAKEQLQNDTFTPLDLR